MLFSSSSLQALWQVRTLSSFGLPVMIFMDDPVIDSYGRYDRIGVDRGMCRMYWRNSHPAYAAPGSCGVHSCSDLDWSLLLEADVDVISFDTYQFADSFLLFPDLIRGFMERGE